MRDCIVLNVNWNTSISYSFSSYQRHLWEIYKEKAGFDHTDYHYAPRIWYSVSGIYFIGW